MRRFGVVCGALAGVALGLAVPARAADLPAAPGYYPPVAYAPAVYNWSGFYFGGNVGAGNINDAFTALTTTPLEAAGNQINVKTWGVLAGGQVGFNYQISSVVLGVEAALTASGIDSALNAASAEPGLASLRVTSQVNWLSDVTARIGYAVDTLLMYVKGGAAWERATYTVGALNNTGVNIADAVIGTNRSGFVVGGGLEYGMTEALTAKFEYDFYDFGTNTYTFNVLDPGNNNVPLALSTSVQSHINSFTVGLNYRFNWVQNSPLLR